MAQISRSQRLLEYFQAHIGEDLAVGVMALELGLAIGGRFVTPMHREQVHQTIYQLRRQGHRIEARGGNVYRYLEKPPPRTKTPEFLSSRGLRYVAYVSFRDGEEATEFAVALERVLHRPVKFLDRYSLF